MHVELDLPQNLLQLRQKVLWPYKLLEDCLMDEDGNTGAFHLSISDEAQKVAGASFFPTNHEAFSTKNQFRLRAMAVDPSYQGRDFGKAIIQRGEEELRVRNAPLLWFDARLLAVGFYEKLGFEKTGDPYQKPLAGVHYLMFKYL